MDISGGYGHRFLRSFWRRNHTDDFYSGALGGPPIVLGAIAQERADSADRRRGLYPGSLEREALPGFLASTVDTVRSVRKLHQVARSTGAQIVTGHDPDVWPTFKQAPKFYD
jgi:hypothetical protein